MKENISIPEDSPPLTEGLTEEQEQDSIIEELLKVACDKTPLIGKTLSEKIDLILSIRVENEFMINQLLQVGTVHDKISVEEAAKINNRSKDSLSDLVRVKNLLEGLPTDRISVENEENQFRMDRLIKMNRN